ncbi:MAG: hypothetical protein MUE97_08225 [Phycisphaerales bacterium]|nr:hypothetical protein [Phycisphaerales bacterium]
MTLHTPPVRESVAPAASPAFRGRHARRVACGALGLAMLALGACTSPNIMAEGPQYRYSSSDLSGAASDTQALLNGPEAQWIEDYVGGPGNLPEYARRDAALAVAPEACRPRRALPRDLQQRPPAGLSLSRPLPPMAPPRPARPAPLARRI